MHPSLTWENVAHHSHLYVLPTAGAGALVVGALTLLGTRPDFAEYLPFALTLLGATALLGSFASYMCLPWSTLRNDRDASARHSGSSPREGVVPTTGSSVTDRHPSGESRRSAGLGRAAVAQAARLWDEPWHQWSTPRSVPLGAPLVGPVPATAYSAPKSGGDALFPERDRDLFFLQKDGRLSRKDGPAAASPSRAPSRPAAPVPPPRPPEPPVERSPAFFSANVGSFLSGPAGILPTLDSLDHPALLESINPILPRLAQTRPKSNPVRTDGESRPPPRGRVRRFCSDCSQHLEDFQTWVECRACRKPLCRKCLHHSFSRGDEGSCSDCADRRNWTVG